MAIAVRFPLRSARCAMLAMFFFASGMLHAYVVYPYPSGSETLYLKWADNHAGTAAGVVYWSFIPPGAAGSSAYCGAACAGTSGDSINMEISPGGGFASMSLVSLRPRIQAMMSRWSAASGIRYVEVMEDAAHPLAVNDPGAIPPATGSIRIGEFAFASGAGEAAVGYAPPPNGGTGAGDILFDANSYYQFAPGNENDAYDTMYAPNDFDSLMLHELGHALGLAHVANDGTCQVMSVDAVCFGRIKRKLTADDIAGTAFLYGEIFYDGFE